MTLKLTYDIDDGKHFIKSKDLLKLTKKGTVLI